MLKIENIYESLVGQDAITFTKGEVDMAKLIYNLFLELPYFAENPQNLKLIATDGESMLRFNQVSILDKGGDKAVLIINTIDEPAITEKVTNIDITSMKATTAALFKVMDQLSHELKVGKVVLLNVCDRFGDHRGMTSAMNFIQELKEKGFDFVGAIETSGYLSQGEEEVFFGSQAILRPALFMAGKITRTTAFYDGIDPSYTLSTIVRDLTLNNELMDQFQNEVSEPIHVNRLIVPGGTDFQSSSFGYTSFATSTVRRTVAEFMTDFKSIIEESVKKSVEETNIKYAQYCLKRDIPFRPVKSIPKVYTYDEYLNELATIRGELVTSALNSKSKEMLEREEMLTDSEYRLRLIRFLYDNFRTANEPVIILYLESTPVHKVDLKGSDDKEKNLMLAVTSSINSIDCSIKRRFYFPEMNYSSFINMTEDEREVKAANKYLPIPSKYCMEIQNLAMQLAIPSVNIGGITKLVNGEYVFDEKYHFEKLPSLIVETIKRLFSPENDSE